MTARTAFVAYHFPPIGGGLSQRSLKFAKYLPGEGIGLEVFSTVEATRAMYRDPDLLGEIDPAIPIHRAADFYSSRLVGVLAARGLEALARLPARIVSHPDIHMGWALRAYRDLVRRHRAAPFEVVFTTSFPWSTHLVGLLASARLGLPWISDFRDPWTLNYEYAHRHPVLRPLDRWLERRVYQASTRVIVNTDGNAADVQGAFPEARAKLVVLPNGYDPDDFGPRTASAARRDGRFHLLYLGGVRGDWFERGLWRALDALASRHPQSYARLTVDFVGASAPAASPHADVCCYHGFRPQHEVGAWLHATDACLLLLPASGPAGPLGWVPQKTYLYLYSGRPILLLGPPGSAADIIAQAGAGRRIDPEHDLAAADALHTWIEAWRTGALAPGAAPAKAAAYSRKVLSHRLAGLLREAAASPARMGARQ